ncbi:MAG: hypothetical protein ABI865_10845 [Nitrosospira sp.]
MQEAQLIIITEQGSENAAKLASNIRESLDESFARLECAKQECGNQKYDNGSDATSRPDEIRNVFYLKSSDGNPKKTGNPDKNGIQPADQVEKVPAIDLHHSSPLPVGPGQLDYFHRLAEKIKNAHGTVNLGKRDSGAKAVVILGSDFNDKLLIIEALREEMPHLLILTTDLDAQMLYPRHWRSTRNLVAASHFDLLLREKKLEDDENKNDETHFWQRSYQNQFPPFRDSQQTNIFYRTLSIAANDDQSIEESKIAFPEIFEVGRNGFVRLDTAEKNDYHPTDNTRKNDYYPTDNTQENTLKQLWLWFVIAVSLIVFHGTMRPWSKPLSWYLFLVTLTIFAIVFYLALEESKEPFSFTDGVSLWPTLLIQIIACFLALIFFVQTICELEGNFCRLSRRYFPALPLTNTFCPNSNEPDECEPWLRRRWDSLGPWLRGLSIKEWGVFVVPFVVLIGSIYVYARNDVYPSDFPFWWCFGILAVVAIIYLIVELQNHVSIKHWMEANNWHPDLPPNPENPESILWRQYYDHGRFAPRIARVVWIWLIFAIIETLLVYLLPPWPLPWRTDPASWIDMALWTGVLSFTVIMLLLFFILDAVRLNVYWIRKLRTQHPLLSGQPLATVDPTLLLRRLEEMILLVAERTRAVDKLIYYPMLCIMLMLLAKIAYFDNQEFPLSKGITFGAAISILFLSGFVLRHEANELKLGVKKSLWDICRKSENDTKKVKKIDKTVKRIEAIDEGAFQPMLEQPVMQALLIILASIGLFAGEYLKIFG